MRLVKQEQGIGCGIACVAMLADVSYHEAKKALFPTSAVRITSSGKLFAALRKLGRKPMGDRMISLKKIDLNDLAHDCLVGCTMYGDKHWVVWDSNRKRILDPYPERHPIKIIKYMPIK